MRNTFFYSAPPELYKFGNNGVQMPNLDISMQVDSIIVFKDDNQLRDGSFAVTVQSLINNLKQDFQYITTSCDNVSQQYSSLLSHKRSLPQFDVNAIGFNGLLPLEGIFHGLDCNKAALNVSKKISKKKIKVISSSEEQWRRQVAEASTEIQNHGVPVRRSQKLSDKITVLQKLVSSYGKTDTASVLQEASLYIKLLQEQIQMLSSSYTSVRALNSQESEEEEQLELRSRGICLVPISFTQKVTKEHLIDPYIISRKIITD